MKHQHPDKTLSEESLRCLKHTLNSLKDDPEFCAANADRLDAANIGFFAFNASLDDDAKGNFHPSFSTFRSHSKDAEMRSRILLRIRRALFDHAALLDQITGGTTFVMHIPGAMEPHTPAEPEYIRAHVYVPGTIIDELESDGGVNVVPDVVQLLIREIGVPTLERFDRIRKKVYGVTRRPSTFIPRPLPEVYGMPMAIPEGSSRYLFYGRKFFPKDELPYIAIDPQKSWDYGESVAATRPSETTRATTPGGGGV